MKPGTLSDADRDRLAKLLGLLESSHQGERDSAALAAHRVVKARGATWFDVVNPAPTNDHRLPERKAPWRDTIADLLQRPYSLRPWERDSLQSLNGFPRLSPKQHACLNAIAGRVLKEQAA